MDFIPAGVGRVFCVLSGIPTLVFLAAADPDAVSAGFFAAFKSSGIISGAVGAVMSRADPFGGRAGTVDSGIIAVSDSDVWLQDPAEKAADGRTVAFSCQDP